MKKTLLGVLLCGAIWAVGSGCNNSESAPAAPTTPAATDTAAAAPKAGAPAGVTSQVPANAPPGVQQYMQHANRPGAAGPGGR